MKDKDKDIKTTFIDAVKLPEFLYKDSEGVIRIGYHGDSDVTKEWYYWLKNNFKTV